MAVSGRVQALSQSCPGGPSILSWLETSLVGFQRSHDQDLALVKHCEILLCRHAGGTGHSVVDPLVHTNRTMIAPLGDYAAAWRIHCTQPHHFLIRRGNVDNLALPKRAANASCVKLTFA